MKPAMTPQQEKLTSGSGISLYKEIAVGEDAGPVEFAAYELITTLFSGIPGLLGLASRSFLYPLLFRKCGARPAIGKGCIIRNPNKISIGSRLLLDDYGCIDARGASAEISIGDRVSIGRYTSLVSKNARISLKNGVNIGSYSRIATQSLVEVGESTLIAAYCYIGPGNHQRGASETPLISRDMEIRGGVKIGAHAWIGAGSTILDGVEVGEGAVIGAHSLVLESIPPGHIAVGSPARIIGPVK